MTPALISLLALLSAIILSMVSRLNIGLIAIALAWLVGVYVADLKADAIIAGFPGSLFLTLTGVTLLFACAESNGSLEQIAHRLAALADGKRALLPVLFFLIACVISTVGPGAISSVALVIPLAMAIGGRARFPHFLTALMVANGANAGNLSPISSVGVIANEKMSEAGLGSHQWKVWLANFVAHAFVAIAAYLIFGRQVLMNNNGTSEAAAATPAVAAPPGFNRRQIMTVVVIALWIVGLLTANLNLGLSAFAAAVLLIASNMANERQVVRIIPWGVILMVCGVSVLIGLLEKTGGMELFTSLLARLANPSSINGVIALITGAISTYSSTSGVVLPAFLPTASKLAAQLGGGDPLAIALSINVGSSLVDVSPLSTLGALCVAAVSDPSESESLFRRLLIWGFSMTIVAAIICQLFAGLLARA